MTDADRLRLALLPGEDRTIVGDPAHVRELLADEVRRLRAANAALNRRCQQAESAVADALRCSEKLASGAAWVGGSLGRALLAWRVGQLEAELQVADAAERERCAAIADAATVPLTGWAECPDRADFAVRNMFRLRERIAAMIREGAPAGFPAAGG